LLIPTPDFNSRKLKWPTPPEREVGDEGEGEKKEGGERERQRY
jgi:hypothetical protein